MKGIAGFYYVDVEESGIYECKAKGIFRKEGQKPLVGDLVEIEILDEAEKTGNMTRILPRKNELIRPAVANIDQALVIFALENPTPNLTLLDRFLVMMEQQNVPTAICFNKRDLAGEDYTDHLRSVYANCGYRVFTVSAAKEQGMEEVEAYLKGKTTVVAGPSGVGKSSITNRMQKEIQMETGEISKKLKNAKHTTRHSQMIPIDHETYLCDTPGFSSLYTTDMEKEELKNFFPEFHPYEGKCRFLGCIHGKEPGCAVKEALEQGNISKERFENYTMFYEELKEQEKSYKAKWQSEKTLVNRIQQNKVEIENLKFEADKAEREGDYGKVAEIRYGKLQALNQEIEDTQKELHAMQGDKAMIKEEVDAEDIADVVSRWTGIPVSKMLQSEKDKLLHLEDELHQRVIGQDEAIEAVADAVRRSRAGLQDPKRPIGSFIFLGTTGVGKTELAKALAEFLFDDESMMTRIDMSEYQEKHSVSRLVGAPPGYVGYDEGGQLTEAIRRKPYSVVLFDEIEKAHPDVFNILLQVLDDGRLTDNKGRVVNFKNTIIIMTSNMGSAYIQSQMEKLNGTNKEQVIEETKKEVMNMLKKTIRPEFLNRIDETIMFLPLNESEIKQIVVLQIKGVQKMLAQNGVELILTDGAIEFLTKVGYDPEFGARPVKRAIQHYLLNDLSKKLLAQEVDRSKPIIVDAGGEGLVFKN